MQGAFQIFLLINMVFFRSNTPRRTIVVHNDVLRTKTGRAATFNRNPKVWTLAQVNRRFGHDGAGHLFTAVSIFLGVCQTNTDSKISPSPTQKSGKR